MHPIYPSWIVFSCSLLALSVCYWAFSWLESSWEWNCLVISWVKAAIWHTTGGCFSSKDCSLNDTDKSLPVFFCPWHTCNVPIKTKLLVCLRLVNFMLLPLKWLFWSIKIHFVYLLILFCKRPALWKEKFKSDFVHFFYNKHMLPIKLDISWLKYYLLTFCIYLLEQIYNGISFKLWNRFKMSISAKNSFFLWRFMS